MLSDSVPLVNGPIQPVQSDGGPSEITDPYMAKIRWCSGPDAIVVVDSKDSPQTSTTIKLRRKDLRSALGLSRSGVERKKDKGITPRSHPGALETALDERRPGSETFQTWLSEHRRVRPVAHVRSKRMRFIGLQNDSTRGVWACLDTDIGISATSTYQAEEAVMNTSQGQEPLVRHFNSSEKTITFPHAVLAVDQEKGGDADLIRILDESHLVSDDRNFIMVPL